VSAADGRRAGRVAPVTGGVRGVGRAIVEALGAERSGRLDVLQPSGGWAMA
jgi:NAD(P)-dependent dehydrogenase (short-subunit alcohol dehydrogenase family)